MKRRFSLFSLQPLIPLHLSFSLCLLSSQLFFQLSPHSRQLIFPSLLFQLPLPSFFFFSSSFLLLFPLLSQHLFQSSPLLLLTFPSLSLQPLPLKQIVILLCDPSFFQHLLYHFLRFSLQICSLLYAEVILSQFSCVSASELLAFGLLHLPHEFLHHRL